MGWNDGGRTIALQAATKTSQEEPPRSKPATAKIPDLASALVSDTPAALGVNPEGSVAVVDNILTHEPSDRSEK
jgi:hypothetical protein